MYQSSNEQNQQRTSENKNVGSQLSSNRFLDQLQYRQGGGIRIMLWLEVSGQWREGMGPLIAWIDPLNLIIPIGKAEVHFQIFRSHPLYSTPAHLNVMIMIKVI